MLSSAHLHIPGDFQIFWLEVPDEPSIIKARRTHENSKCVNLNDIQLSAS